MEKINLKIFIITCEPESKGGCPGTSYDLNNVDSVHNGSYTDHLTFPMPEPVEDVIVINGSSLFIAQIGVSGLRLLSRQRFLLLALSVKHADFFFYSFPQEIGNIICDIHLVPRLFP